MRRFIAGILFFSLFVVETIAQQSPVNDLRQPRRDWSTVNQLRHTDEVFELQKAPDFEAFLSPGFLEAEIAPLARVPQSPKESLIVDPAVRQAGWQDDEEADAPTESSEVENEDSKPDEEEVDTEPTKPEKIDYHLPEINQMVADVQREIEVLNSDNQLDELVRSERLNILNTTSEWLGKAQSYHRILDKFQTEVDRFDQEMDFLLSELQYLDSTLPPPPLNVERPIDQLQREYQRIKSELETKQTEVASLHDEVQRFTQRITEIPAQKSEAEKRLKQIQQRLRDSSQLETETGESTDMLQMAMKLATESELEMLNLETRQLELAAQLSPFRIDLGSRLINRYQDEYQQLKSAVTVARKNEVERQIQLAREAAIQAHPSLAVMADRNQFLAARRLEIANKITEIYDESELVSDQAKSVNAELNKLEKQVEKGVSQTNRMLFAETKRQLISPLESRVRLHQIQNELQNVNALVLQHQDESVEIADPQAYIFDVLDVEQGGRVESKVMAMAMEFVNAKRDLLNALLHDYRAYRSLLAGVSAKRNELLDGIQLTNELLNKHMMWAKSTNAVSLATFKKASLGASELFRPELWGELNTKLAKRAKERPYEYGLFALGFFALLVVSKKLKNK